MVECLEAPCRSSDNAHVSFLVYLSNCSSLIRAWSVRDIALVHPQRLRVEELIQLPPLAPVVAKALVGERQVEKHICR